MAVPQGSATLNTAYFDALIARINGFDVCADLQAAVNDATSSIGDVKAAINAEMAKLAPILALLTAPTSLGALITWAQNMINGVLQPIYQPYLTYEAQLIALATEISRLTAAISAAEARITSCSISIPTI